MTVLLIAMIASIICGLEASISSACNANDDCSTLDSYCSPDKKCVCLNGLVEHEGECVHTIPNLPCTDASHCLTADPRSICVNSRCVCIKYHHFISSGCTRNKGLFEKCFANDECYWGKEMEGKILCTGGTCSCAPGYKQIGDRKCGNGSSPSAIAAVGSLVLALSLRSIIQ